MNDRESSFPSTTRRLTTRREFLCRLALAPAAVALLARTAAAGEASQRVRFGVITDVHQDVMPDGVQRITAFVDAMHKAKPDFVLQLGDFCQPIARNKPFLDAWNTFQGERHHVLGNHDMDGGVKPDQSAKFYGMPARYYAFSSGPLKFIVLDGNEPGGKAKGYHRYISPAQLKWLEGELQKSATPVVIFVHQPLDEHAGGVENAPAVRASLEKAEKAHPGRILAVFSGHLHRDYQRQINGIRYVEINSASYWWLATPAAARETYPPEVHKAHPSLKNVAAYRDPLWAVVTIDLDQGELTIEGRRSTWVGPDPWHRGEKTEVNNVEIQPVISDRQEKLASHRGAEAQKG